MLSFYPSDPVGVWLGQRFTCRKVVMAGGIVGCLGISLSGLAISIEFVIVFFGLAFGEYFKNKLCFRIVYVRVLISIPEHTIR
jgi:hypothetical protein